MIAKSFSDKGTPRVRINEDRLAALSQAPKRRFGLSEQRRRQAFRDLVAAEDRARRDAKTQVPDSRLMEQITLERKLGEIYKANVAQQYGLTNDQLLKISVEALKNGWLMPRLHR